MKRTDRIAILLAAECAVVFPEYRGQGVSERLYRGLINHCKALKTPAFKIIVGEVLLPAHRFYGRMGAGVVGEVCVHGDQRSLIYVQPVN